MNSIMTIKEVGLTGKTRYRVSRPLFQEPRVILEVEVQKEETCTMDLSTYEFKVWRDAKPEDLQHLNK